MHLNFECRKIIVCVFVPKLWENMRPPCRTKTDKSFMPNHGKISVNHMKQVEPHGNSELKLPLLVVITQKPSVDVSMRSCLGLTFGHKYN